MAKDCPKLPKASLNLTQGKDILWSGFKIKVSDASNLLKISLQVNNIEFCCFLDLGTTNLFITSQVMQHLGIKAKEVVDP